MAEGRKNMNMLEGNLLGKILLFSLPVLASNYLQQLFHAADTAVVGRFAGSIALAAVGGNTHIINLFINFFVGLSLGANVVVARALGAGEEKKASDAIPTVMVTSVISGFVLMVLGFLLTKPLLVLIGSPQEIIESAAVYLRIYFLGMPFIMVFNFGSAVLRSVGDTRRPLYALLFAGIANVLLDLLFVVKLHLGVVGVGVATVVSNGISASFVFWMLLHHRSAVHLSLSGFSFRWKVLGEMAKVGLPAGLQTTMFSLSNVVVLSAVNSFGAAAVAASAATSTYEVFSNFIQLSITQAAVTFTSQNYGAGKYDRCRKILWVCLALSMGLQFAFDLLIFTFRSFFLSIFTTDAAVLEFAFLKLLLGLMPHSLVNTYEVPGACLRGMGKSMTPAVITLVCCCFLRLFWVFLVLPFHHVYWLLMVVFPLSWVVAGAVMNIAYFRISRRLFAA